MMVERQQNAQLSLTSPPGIGENQTLGVVGLKDERLPSHGVLFDKSAFPFAESSIVTLNPPGINAQDLTSVLSGPDTSFISEMQRCGGILLEKDTSLMGKLPVLGKIKGGIEFFTQRDKTQAKLMRGFITDCINHGVVRPRNVPDFVKKMLQSDASLMFLDMGAAGATEVPIYFANPLLGKYVYDATGGDLFWTGISQFAGQGAVRGLYLSVRAYQEAQAYFHNRKRTPREKKDFLKLQGKIFVLGFIPVVGALAMPFISLSRNGDLLKKYGQLQKAKMDKLFSQPATVAENGTGYVQPYEWNREGNLLNRALNMREWLEKSRIPVLTAGVVGQSVLSRAHVTGALAFGQLNGKGKLPMVDVAQFLPSADFHKMKGVAAMGETVTRHETLNTLRANFEPVARRLINQDKTFGPAVSFFMDGLGKTPHRPVVTFHDMVGNAACSYLIRSGRTDIPVVHYVTDPFVRENYLKYKDFSFVYYFVFDEKTREEMILLGVDPGKVYVTGVPLSPDLDLPHDPLGLRNDLEPDKVRLAKENKSFLNIKDEYKYSPENKLRVGVFTGGLGGNQREIMETARNLDYGKQQGIFYCGTHWDLASKLNDYFTHKKGFDQKRIRIIIPEENEETKFTGLTDLGQDDVVIIVGSNLRNLIPYSYMALNRAQVVCTKPSGDISLEALQANKLQVLYNHQGPQEFNVAEIVRKAGGQVFADLNQIGKHLEQMHGSNQLWIQAERLRQKLTNRRETQIPYNWMDRAEEYLAEVAAKSIDNQNSLSGRFPYL